MDPTQAMIELVDAVFNDDFDTALDRLDGLLQWRAKGGFPPKRRTVIECLRIDMHVQDVIG